MNPGFAISVGSWKQLGRSAAAIRHQVFVLEQNVPVELELDENDATAVHAVAFDGDTPIGTGRLLPDAHIGRMAVLAAYRGKGVGAMLLVSLAEQARLRGDAGVVLAAQSHAQRFYRAHGFEPEGDMFMDAGIPHVLMRRFF